MNFKVKRSALAGDIRIPPSKSHTIRAAVFAGLARGTSVIHGPLKSDDTLACLNALRQLGTEVTEDDNWTIRGFNGRPRVPDAALDVKNSGTSLRFLSAVAALADGEIEITGDASTQTRPMEPLLNALRSLGAVMAESKKKNGRAPLTVRGRAAGGMASVDGVTSQFISALLIIAPLLKRNSQLKVVKLNERPYIEITLYWLRKLGIEFTKKGRNNFNVTGGQTYYPFERAIPADFSSATFPLVGALITEGSDVLLKGLDMTDPQGDKKIIEIVKEMGGQVEAESGGVRVKFSELEGDEIDLNEMPDALPALAVLGCFAEGETKLVNVPQARLKETDRIKVMAGELRKMGADVEELKDGLAVRKSALTGAKVNGHGDHRVVMALALAGLAAEGETEITTAESASVTFPGFRESMQALGAAIEEVEGAEAEAEEEAKVEAKAEGEKAEVEGRAKEPEEQKPEEEKAEAKAEEEGKTEEPEEEKPEAGGQKPEEEKAEEAEEEKTEDQKPEEEKAEAEGEAKVEAEVKKEGRSEAEAEAETVAEVKTEEEGQAEEQKPEAEDQKPVEEKAEEEKKEEKPAEG
jgi:3-phosphoshikimate 1-carboxyvinyltransferase